MILIFIVLHSRRYNIAGRELSRVGLWRATNMALICGKKQMRFDEFLSSLDFSPKTEHATKCYITNSVFYQRQLWELSEDFALKSVKEIEANRRSYHNDVMANAHWRPS